MGLNEFNKIFEGYDPNYDPSSDFDRIEREKDLHEYASDLISDAIAFEELENRLELLTKEEKLYLLKSFNDSDALLDAIDRLGIQQFNSLVSNKPSNLDLAIKNNKIFEKLSKEKIKKIIKEVVFNKIEKLIKRNSECFSDLVSLQDIIEDWNLFLLFDPGLHLKRSDVNLIITDDFKNYIKQDRINYYQPAWKSWEKFDKNKYDWNNLKDKNRAFSNLSQLFVDYHKKQGNKIYHNNPLYINIFSNIARKFPEIYQELFDLSNPANYIGKALSEEDLQLVKSYKQKLEDAKKSEPKPTKPLQPLIMDWGDDLNIDWGD